ncbi:MAG TPA: M56 family metallopeptidase [Candidatus Sulfotelmatobacter sp.]
MTPAHLSTLDPSAMWRDLAPALGNHLWQSTLFAAAAGLLTFMLRKNHARARYWLWLAASVKFLIPFSLLVSIGSYLAWPHAAPRPSGGLYVAVEAISQPFSEPALAMPAMAQAAPAAVPPSLLHWLPALLVAFWFCGFVVVLCAWCVRWRRISAALRESAPLRAGREAAALRRLERMAGTRKPIDIVLSRASLEPGIFGIVRPVLIWPEGISRHLEDAHLEAILAHEVWHVRRRDNLAAALHMVVEALFWFHPLVWWLGARMVEERERACDEEVVELGSERQVYAESILKVCEFCVGSPLACVSGVTGSDLKRRMVYIMTKRIARKLDFGRKLLLSTAGVLALALPLVFGLANAPKMRAQEQAATAGASASNVELMVKSGAGGEAHRVGMMYSPTGFKAMNTTLQALIQEAYGVQANQIAGGPDWIKTAEFDLEIGPEDDKSVPSGMSIEQSLEQSRIRNQRLLQAALAERFKLALHPETRELSTYALVVGDDGSKLQPAKPASSYPDPAKGPEGVPLNKSFRIKLDGSQAGLEARGMSTSDMASHISRQLGTVVVDKTGLAGAYDFSLNWMSDASGGGTFNAPVSAASASSLLAAIQEQLGLKLEPQKSPMQVLVIDHAERPTETTQN